MSAVDTELFDLNLFLKLDKTRVMQFLFSITALWCISLSVFLLKKDDETKQSFIIPNVLQISLTCLEFYILLNKILLFKNCSRGHETGFKPGFLDLRDYFYCVIEKVIDHFWE